MLKYLRICLVVLSFFVFLSSNAFAVTVRIDGEDLKLGKEPIIENGTTIVPMRAFFEAMGATVKWHSDSQTIVALRGGRMILLGINYPIAITYNPVFQTNVNDIKATKLTVKPKIINGSTFIPLRYVGESLNADVNWNGETEAITIKTSVDYRNSPSEETITQLHDAFKQKWDFKVWNAISNQEVFVGMTAKQALLSWGEPDSINTTIIGNYKTEQWVYEIGDFKYQFIYVENGKVTAIQTYE